MVIIDDNFKLLNYLIVELSPLNNRLSIPRTSENNLSDGVHQSYLNAVTLYEKPLYNVMMVRNYSLERSTQGSQNNSPENYKSSLKWFRMEQCEMILSAEDLSAAQRCQRKN